AQISQRGSSRLAATATIGAATTSARVAAVMTQARRPLWPRVTVASELAIPHPIGEAHRGGLILPGCCGADIVRLELAEGRKQRVRRDAGVDGELEVPVADDALRLG